MSDFVEIIFCLQCFSKITEINISLNGYFIKLGLSLNVKHYYCKNLTQGKDCQHKNFAAEDIYSSLSNSFSFCAKIFFIYTDCKSCTKPHVGRYIQTKQLELT